MYKNEEQYKKVPKFLFFVAVLKSHDVGHVSDLFPVSYQCCVTFGTTSCKTYKKSVPTV